MLFSKPRAASRTLLVQTAVSTSVTRLESLRVNLRARYGWTGVPLTLAVAVRLMVFVTGVVGSRLLGMGTFPGIFGTWAKKDTLWYGAIARKGYFSVNGQPLSANFFPLYPLTISLGQHITRVFSRSDSYLLAGMAVAWLAFLIACVLLFRLVSDRFGERTAYLSVLLLAVFPFSFYYGAAYSESLYLLCALLAFTGIERGNWWLAGTGALLAGAARPIGLSVGLAVVVAYMLDWLRTRHHLQWNILALALTPLGAVAFAVYSWVRFGDPLSYMKASAEGWGGHLQLGAVAALVRILTHPIYWFHGVRGSLLDLIYALVFLAFLVSWYPIYRLLGASFLVYTVVSSMAPILDFSSIKSSGRYMSVLFPTFIVLAYALRNKPSLRDMTFIGFALLLAVAVIGFTGGYGFS